MLKSRLIQNHYAQKTEPSWLNLLKPLGWLYQAAGHLRLAAYRKNMLKETCVSVPVISVGNITTGGTGKTPLVVAIAETLIQHNKKVVILSRGYGAEMPVNYERATDPFCGDEAAMMQAMVPEAIVIVGKNRVRNARRAINDYQPDVILLDDGFQYVGLHRDLNILLVDGQQLFGNKSLLPLGPLREPLREIRRADLIVLTKQISALSIGKLEDTLSQAGIQPGRIPVLSLPFQQTEVVNVNHPEVLISAEILKDIPLVAFCGIARPDSFFSALSNLGIQPVETRSWPDHYRYRKSDIDELRNWPKPHLFLTTEKDWVKLKYLWPAQRDNETHQPEWERMYVLKSKPMLDTQWFYQQYLAPLFKANP